MSPWREDLGTLLRVALVMAALVVVFGLLARLFLWVMGV